MRNHFEQNEYVRLVNSPSKIYVVIVQNGSRVSVKREYYQTPEVVALRSEIIDRSLLERL
jgi:hypothetical protein